MQFTEIACCPVPTTDHMDKIIDELLQDSGATLESCYRGEDPNAAKYLTGTAPCFKHDQEWIYDHYPPGVANPPYHSTHECYNDGAAYPVPDGAKLEAWQVGMDIRVEKIAEYMAAGRKRGYVITLTYPGSPVEAHHCNFRFKPGWKPPFDDLRHGDHGKRVVALSKRLHYIREPHGAPYLDRPAHRPWVPYRTFREEVVHAVRTFQSHYHLPVDGVVGLHTFEQIERTFRSQWKHRHHGRAVPARHRVALEHA